MLIFILGHFVKYKNIAVEALFCQSLILIPISRKILSIKTRDFSTISHVTYFIFKAIPFGKPQPYE